MSDSPKQRPARSIGPEKARLREMLTGYQIELADLRKTMAEQKETFGHRQGELLADLFEVMDALENMDRVYSAKEDGLEKTAKRILQGVRAVGRKVERLLKARGIAPMEFPEGLATATHCKVIDTRPLPEATDERIISVEKQGYIDSSSKEVLRKAEVITVRNS